LWGLQWIILFEISTNPKAILKEQHYTSKTNGVISNPLLLDKAHKKKEEKSMMAKQIRKPSYLLVILAFI